MGIYGAARTPFSLLVWQQIDGYLFKQSSADKAERMLKDAYEFAREMVMRGHPLPEMHEAAIEQEGRVYKRASQDSVEAAAEALSGLLGRSGL